MEQFNKNMLLELRTLIVEETDEKINDNGLVKAMTINEELKGFGCTLKPLDIIELAKTKHPEIVLNSIKEVYDLRGYKPMYPDFPKQVMEMSEAQYRFDQMVHYFSTYGVEMLFGVEVSQGWMPSVKETEKTEDDIRLMDYKVLELSTKQEAYDKIATQLLPKKERWTIGEKQLVLELANNDISKVKNVAFKENFITLFNDINKEDRTQFIKNNCQHVGDVLKTIDEFLTYKQSKGINKLSTSEKKNFVHVLETFPVKDFEENIAVKRDRNIHLLEELSYNRFSTSSEHKEVVRKVRNKELRTFYSHLEEKIANKDKDLLEFYAKRPGEMVRGLTRLMRMGYSEDELFKVLKGKEFKVQTLISNINFAKNPVLHEGTYFAGTRSVANCEEDYERMANICHKLLIEDMKKWNTPFKNKDVYIEKGQYDLEHSFISGNEKNAEGGYIQSGLAFSIPKDAKAIRLFVFWDDRRKRVDLDLHANLKNIYDEDFHVGWNSNYSKNGVVMSGDITTSQNSAEYIDIDLKEAKDLKTINLNLYSFTRDAFKDINTCYIGITAVNKIGEQVKQYDPKNLMFYHKLKGDKTEMEYGTLNIKDGYIRLFDEKEKCWNFRSQINYNVKDFLDDLCKAQKCKIITEEKDKQFADLIIRMDKGQSEKELSLIDHNFFFPTNKLEEKELVRER